MFYNQPVKKISTLLLLCSLLASFSACSKGSSANVTITTANPLFDAVDIQSTSLQSGNLHFNTFLTSDGKKLFFQSVDGKSLVKSDYDGKNLVVLSNRFPAFINVIDNMVYFIEGSVSGKIFKVDVEGKGETMVIDANATSLIVTSDYLFFIDTKDGFAYYSLHDGSKKKLLLDKITSLIQLVDDNIYLQPEGESKGIYVFPIKNLDAVSKSASTASGSSMAASSASSAASANAGAAVSEASKTLSDSKAAATPTLSPAPRTDVNFVQLVSSNIGFKSMNIYDYHFYYIDITKGSYLYMNDSKKQSIVLKKSLDFSFIISGKYIYYINQDDESRLYRISIQDDSVNKTVINDRISQFVVCGNSIYYRREGKLDIFRTPVEGGISDKIT